MCGQGHAVRGFLGRGDCQMSDELEVIGAASIGALASDTTGDGYLNGPCPNCETELTGNFCSQCGQSAKDLKKPFLTLLRDILGDVFAFDGRLWRTLPALMLLPGKITQAYLDGKRMRYVPPFRLFLIASVLFFLVLFGITGKQSWVKGDDFNLTEVSLDIIEIDGKPLGEYEGFDNVFDEAGAFDRAAAERFMETLRADGVFDGDDEEASDLLGRLEDIDGNKLSRSELLRTAQKWVPRLSFLLLPIYVLSLVIMHFWMRRIYIYDHVIVALHMQSFFYLAATIGMLLPMVHPGIVWGVFGISTFVYPFILMRRAYRTNWFFNIFRVCGLYISTLVAVLMITILGAFVGANELGLMSWLELAQQLGDNTVDIE